MSLGEDHLISRRLPQSHTGESSRPPLDPPSVGAAVLPSPRGGHVCVNGILLSPLVTSLFLDFPHLQSEKFKIVTRRVANLPAIQDPPSIIDGTFFYPRVLDLFTALVGNFCPFLFRFLSKQGCFSISIGTVFFFREPGVYFHLAWTKPGRLTFIRGHLASWVFFLYTRTRLMYFFSSRTVRVLSRGSSGEFGVALREPPAPAPPQGFAPVRNRRGVRHPRSWLVESDHC